jgi:hypothetical protein
MEEDLERRRKPRQPSVEIGKHLFETLVADDRAGRTRSLSARGAASLAMYLTSIGQHRGPEEQQ